MKNSFITLTILSFLFVTSCKDGKQQVETEAEVIEQTHDLVEAHDDHHDIAVLDNSWVEEISLNDGAKWNANIETTEGVNNMLEHIESMKTDSVEDYHALAAKLNDEKNYIVKECTMEGASHDNLHTFLHPLIDKIAALGKIESIDEGVHLKSIIQENLQKYSDYFM